MQQSAPSSSSYLAVLLVLCAEVLIYCSASWAKHLFPVVGAEGVTTYRLFFSAAVLALVSRPWQKPIPRDEWRPHLLFGVGLGGMFLFSYAAIRYVPLGISVGVQMLGPLVIALAASRRPRDFAWVGLAATGIWLLLRPDAVGQVDMRGVALAGAAAGCWAMYIWFGKAACARDCCAALALAMFTGGVATLPLSLVTVGGALLESSSLLFGLLLALSSAAVPCLLEMQALRRITPKVYGTLMSLAPAVAALMGCFWLDEQLSAGQWGGIASVVAASAGMTLAAE
ncbi:MAG TPA: hypothetical protein DEF41_10970 [Desulfovibrio sp.]|nr:hypothetical protein [Desulfovibrio sp.]